MNFHEMYLRDLLGEEATDTERALGELILTEGPCNMEDALQAANAAYEEIFMEIGAQAWRDVLVPQATQVYGGSHGKNLAEFLLEVIQRASSLRSEEVAAYLQTAVSREELAFSTTDKEAHARQAFLRIQQMIVEQTKMNKEGLVAVVVWGSYARYEQRLESDLDLELVYGETDQSQDSLIYGHYDEDELYWKGTEHYTNLLFGMFKDIEVQSEAALDDPDSLVYTPLLQLPHFVVISPHEDIRASLEEEIRRRVEKFFADRS